jgi:hypothetical protein
MKRTLFFAALLGPLPSHPFRRWELDVPQPDRTSHFAPRASR